MGQVVRRNRKMQLRIARRKEKVQRLIREQDAHLETLDLAAFPHQRDYLRAVRKSRSKLHRLERELSSLEDGHLPGPWV